MVYVQFPGRAHHHTSEMKLRILFVFLVGFLSHNVHGQGVDTTLTGKLETVVITAERAASTLSSATAGISVLSSGDLRVLPNLNASHILSLIPGVTVLDFDGLGYSPQTVTRGFYGGGEAEYMIVLVNGKPINNLENGLINWDQISISKSGSIEVLRGSASSLYGDAAIGAVLNIVSGPVEGTYRHLRGSLGSLGIGSIQGSVHNNRYSAMADFHSTDGFRDHSGRTSGTLRGSYRLLDENHKSVSVSGMLNLRDFDTPGPLRTGDGEEDRSVSLAFFRFDHGTEKTLRSSIEGELDTRIGLIGASITGELRNQDLIRTLPLSADFADTQERRVDARTLKASAQVSGASLPIPIANSVIAGVDASIGSLDSRYHHIATGGLEDTYLAASGDRGDLLSDGTATRRGAAGYLQLELNPTARMKVSAGARLDWIRDSFAALKGLSESLPSASHTAFSPKAGVNYRFLSSETQVGNVYASLSRSFKAPTLDQLYDLRAFPVPFPPFAIQISNASLNPQFGTSYEVGFYHRVDSRDGLSVMLSGSIYQIDMTDEIDFSFETFSNVNIGESRHRGVETGIRIAQNNVGSAFLNYTLQDVTISIGENRGSAVKAIPRHTFGGGIVADFGSVTSSIVVKANRTMYVDDANSRRIPDYTVVDARLTYALRDYTLTLDVFNVLDREYSSTAFPDPAGTETIFRFPAASRTISVGVELGL